MDSILQTGARTDVHPAGFGQRIGATLIDWIICVVGPFMALGFLAVMLSPLIPDWLLILWIPALAMIIVGYVAAFTYLGATIGMRLAGVRVMSEATGHAPGLGRSLLRGVLALSGVGAAIVLMMYGFSDPPATGYAQTDVAILAIAMLLLAAHVLGRLWMLVDRSHRTIFDRLLGLIVIRGTMDTQRQPGSKIGTAP
jgi:uncharacterized RDD family membrane protein YckC